MLGRTSRSRTRPSGLYRAHLEVLSNSPLLSSGGLDADSLIARLEELLVLPELGAPLPQRLLLLASGDPAMVRMAAAIAGPAWVLPADSSWNLTIPARQEEAAPLQLGAGISAATRRRERTVLVWRHGTTVGLQVWRGGFMDASWAWAHGWETVVADPWELETSVCDAICPIQPDLHLPTLRALLRQTELDDASLDRLADLLKLPSGLAATLRDSALPKDIPGAELIEETTPRSAWLATMRSDWARGPLIRSRSLYIAYAVGTLIAALVCLGMTVLGIAIVLTDGSAVDQTGVTTEDRAFVGIFALLTLVLAPTAIYRLNKARTWPETAGTDT